VCAGRKRGEGEKNWRMERGDQWWVATLRLKRIKERKEINWERGRGEVLGKMGWDENTKGKRGHERNGPRRG